MTYRPEIDGLRGIAVLLVLLFHFDVVAMGKAGFVGVDVFFVISGFLISSILWHQLERGTFTLVGFYLRRFRRLAPALLCVQLLLIGLAYLVLLPQETKDLAAQSLATQAYVVNFYLWRHINYFDLHADGVVLLHCWSLAIEEQFYFLYPLFLLLLHRYARRHLFAVLAGFALLSFTLNVLLVGPKPQAAFYLLPTRAWELLLGALIPAVQPYLGRQRRTRQAVAALGVVGLLASLVLYQPGIAFPGFYALLPTVAGACLIASSVADGTLVTRLLSTRVLVFIGQISYSLYLVHWPIKVIAEDFLPRYGLAWRWASMALAFLLATALFHAVEDPIRKGTYFRRPARFVLAYAAGFTAVVALATSALSSDGWRRRFSPDVLRVADATNDRDEEARACEYRQGRWPGPDGPCHIGAAGVPSSWAIVGDSHAWALDRAFSLFLDHRHEAGVLVFAHGCMPIEGMGDPDCLAFASDVNAWIERSPNVHNVVLVSIWRQPIEGLHIAGGQFADGQAAIAAFQRSFALTLRGLRKTGKNVYVWESLPAAKRPVPGALARNLAFGLHLDVASSRNEQQRLFDFLHETLVKNHDLVAGTISPVSTMCRGATCAIESDGAPLFFDDNHPAWSRAPYYARILEEQLGDAVD